MDIGVRIVNTDDTVVHGIVPSSKCRVRIVRNLLFIRFLAMASASFGHLLLISLNACSYKERELIQMIQ